MLHMFAFFVLRIPLNRCSSWYFKTIAKLLSIGSVSNYCQIVTGQVCTPDTHPNRVSLNAIHNYPIYDEYQTHFSNLWTLSWERAHHDSSNGTPQAMTASLSSFYCGWRLTVFRLLINTKRNLTWNSHTYRLWGIIGIVCSSTFSWHAYF